MFFRPASMTHLPGQAAHNVASSSGVVVAVVVVPQKDSDFEWRTPRILVSAGIVGAFVLSPLCWAIWALGW